MNGELSVIQRSTSPNKPKPNESDPPEGTHIVTMDEGNSANIAVGDIVISQSMLDEEKKLEKEGDEQEEKLMKKQHEAWKKRSQEMGFRRLQHLLEKSNIYSNFLLTRMEAQQAEAQKIKEKSDLKLAKKRKLEQAGGKEKTASTPTASPQKSKKRSKDKVCGISDFISKEDIETFSKKRKVESDAALGEASLPKSDVESNGVIRERLGQVVRQNAAQMWHPNRMINGQKVPFHQPRLFTGGIMRSYQVEGMEWLRILWENGINGILADEMGLGKTVQCIATVALMVESSVMGPFLVVAPLSTLPNWISEFKRFTPKIPVMLYHGSADERRLLRPKIAKKQGELNICPVIVTSYEIAMIDAKYLQTVYWKYLMLDEGHRIKNLNCRLIRELKRYHSENKLLLTGTPLQNNLAELWSLLNFLLPEVFDDLKSFETWFDVSNLCGSVEEIVAKEQQEQVLHMLHQILTPFLLRRLKADVTIDVPPKREVLVYAPLTAAQDRLYKAIVNKTIRSVLNPKPFLQEVQPEQKTPNGRPRRHIRKEINYAELNDSVNSIDNLEELIARQAQEEEQYKIKVDWAPQKSELNVQLSNILMMLRKCCNHPYLIEYPLTADREFKVDENLVKSSGKLLLLDRILPELRQRGHKVLIFSQMVVMLEILMDYCYLRKFHFSRLDGSMKYSEREENMHKFNTDPDVFIFLLSTRAGGLGINLTAADTVIIYDSDWNPQVDLQAQDRCHRIGQTRPVVVYRMVTANTVDQRIVERAGEKRRLEKLVIHNKQFKGGQKGMTQVKNSLDPQELIELLKCPDHQRVVEGSVISDKNLDLLLDRSDLVAGKSEEDTSKQAMGVFKVVNTSNRCDMELRISGL
ncbi:lymphoid-specific helicase isoform X1 [Petromyzon marinus]|uniref:Proliferation-associated SNF2-like protein n=1 Tax=Petromyzon marinus TaxID=7757 RepID=A0AAJ7TWC1_PETMA|nr:lymphoid-specific helicase isoform X1 [Petromyzon marinus]